MHVLEKIKEAEIVAENLRVEAKNKVQQLIDETNNTNSETTQKMIDEAKLEISKLNEQNEAYLAKLEKESLEECDHIIKASEELAKAHLNETVEFILKKVIAS